MFGTDSIDGETVGFIDIGTNSVHLLVVRFYEGTMGTMVFQDKEVIRLGQNLYSSGYIDRDTIEKARLVISDFAQVSRKMGADRVIAMATSAARDAVNKKDLLDAIRSDGVEVSIIPGYEEARLIRLGVFGPVAPKEKSLIIDIGGGSTEVVLCREREDIYLDSMSMGAVRFAYGSGIPNDKALKFADYDHLRREVDLQSYHTCRKIRELGFSKAYGSSGTMIAMAEMCTARRGDGDASYMMYYEVVEVMKSIYTKDLEERKTVPGMNPARADIIVAGGAIVEEMMYLLGIDRIDISQNGLRQGMQIDYLVRHGHSDFDVRGSSVLALAGRCQYDRDHANFIRLNSLRLFDRLKELGVHDMGPDMRELLSYACTLHDIGEFINYPKHHLYSYLIITNSNLAGFTTEELNIMGLIARFHHKKFPSAASKIFGDMPPGLIKQVRECAMMLKIADILDRRHCSAIKETAVDVSDDVLMLDLTSEYDISMEVWKLTTISSEIEDVFGLKLKIIRS